MEEDRLKRLLELLPPGQLKEDLMAGRLGTLRTLTAQAVMIRPKLEPYLVVPNDEMTAESRTLPSTKDIRKGEHPSSLASPTELPTGADAGSEFRCWVLEEWRRVSIPEWRRVLREAEAQGDARREEYARWMLREVLEADES